MVCLPHQDLLVLHSTSSSKGEQTEEEEEMNYNYHHFLCDSLACLCDLEGANDEGQFILSQISACGLLCSEIAASHERNTLSLCHLLVPVLLSVTCSQC